jgi:hypothetical protein
VAEVLRWPGVLADDGLSANSCRRRRRNCSPACWTTSSPPANARAPSWPTCCATAPHACASRSAAAEPLLPAALAAYRERLATKLREAVANLDEERIRQEVGVFAAKIDVAEEIARLITHMDELDRVLKKGGAVGKRLDFLMQELNREANTLSSKSVSGEVTAIALELKLLIEQMREQVQNLELQPGGASIDRDRGGQGQGLFAERAHRLLQRAAPDRRRQKRQPGFSRRDCR